MEYSAVLDYLYSKLPMFYREGKIAYKNNLDNIKALDDYLNFPHRNFMTIHIAGTNGKGSVSHMLAAILQTAGYKTGLFTSPHLMDFRERIKVNGQMISKDEVVEFVTVNYEILERIQPSFFEMSVAMAFNYFYNKQVDIAVIETGLGGRLDSTNIITPLVSVITNISLDHTDILGNTLAAIAFEKAGIIKPEIPVVVGESNDEYNKVFLDAAQINNSEITFADSIYSVMNSLESFQDVQILFLKKNGIVLDNPLKLDLLGHYQQKNIISVFATVDILRKAGLKISQEVLFSALEKVCEITGLLGRWQVLGQNPLIACDTGHNEEGIRWVVSQLKRVPYRHLHFVFGMVNDKDTTSILKLLPSEATYYFTKANLPRAMDEKKLASAAKSFNLNGGTYEKVKDAFLAAKNNAQPEDLIFVSGSSFVVAEVLANRII